MSHFLKKLVWLKKFSISLQNGIPVMTLPFVLSTMLLILTSDERSNLSRIQEAMGYPDRHAYIRFSLTRSAKRVSCRGTRKR